MMSTSPPKYLHIKTLLNRAIADGTMDHRLPSENELARRHRVSRMTARKALNELLRDGLVERIPGKGTFVKQHRLTQAYFHIHAFSENAGRLGVKTRTRLIRSAVEAMPARLMDRIPGRRAVCIRRVHWLDAQPVCFEVRYLREDWCAPLLDEDLERNSVHALIVEKLDLPISRVWQRLEAVSLAADVAAELNSAAGLPAFCMRQLIYSRSAPISYVDYFLRSDVYAFEDSFEPGNAAASGWAENGRFTPDT
jgi:GntR family transcriptional regulator